MHPIASIAAEITSQEIGIGAVALLALGLAKDVVKAQLPTSWKNGKGGGCPMQAGDATLLREAHAVVTQRDGEGNTLSHFPRAHIERDHVKQTEILQKVASVLEINTRILEKMEERDCPRGAKEN